jgi:hypothetical protein
MQHQPRPLLLFLVNLSSSRIQLKKTISTWVPELVWQLSHYASARPIRTILAAMADNDIFLSRSPTLAHRSEPSMSRSTGQRRAPSTRITTRRFPESLARANSFRTPARSAALRRGEGQILQTHEASTDSNPGSGLRFGSVRLILAILSSV